MGWKTFLGVILRFLKPDLSYILPKIKVFECDYKYYCAWRGDYPLLMGQGWTEEEAIKVLDLAIKKEEELERRNHPDPYFN